GRLHADTPQPLRRRNAPAACTATERGRLSGEKLRLLSRRTSGPAATAPPYGRASPRSRWPPWRRAPSSLRRGLDRKSTRLNSSHVKISYAVFCLKKKKETNYTAHLHYA